LDEFLLSLKGVQRCADGHIFSIMTMQILLRWLNHRCVVVRWDGAASSELALLPDPVHKLNDTAKW